MSEEQVKQFLAEATQSLQGQQFQQALELIEQAIALSPSNSEAYVLKGIALSQLNQPDAATEAFQKAIMHGPYNVKAFYNLAVHYYAMGKKVPAEEMAREALRTDPKHAGARDLYARLQAEKSVPGSAVPTPESLKEGKPGTPPPGTGMAPPPGTGVAPPDSGPMAPPPGTGMGPPAQPAPPPGTGVAPPYYGPPTGQPPSGPAPYTPPPAQPAGYYRPGYEQSGVHSVSFVANLGKNWDTAGWGLAIIATLIGVVGLVQTVQLGSQNGWDFVEITRNRQNMAVSAGDLLLNLLLLFNALLSAIWMIMELSDRRGNWLWLLPYILCCCCTCGFFYGPVMMIYLWKGRE